MNNKRKVTVKSSKLQYLNQTKNKMITYNKNELPYMFLVNASMGYIRNMNISHQTKMINKFWTYQRQSNLE